MFPPLPSALSSSPLFFCYCSHQQSSDDLSEFCEISVSFLVLPLFPTIHLSFELGVSGAFYRRYLVTSSEFAVTSMKQNNFSLVPTLLPSFEFALHLQLLYSVLSIVFVNVLVVAVCLCCWLFTCRESTASTWNLYRAALIPMWNGPHNVLLQLFFVHIKISDFFLHHELRRRFALPVNLSRRRLRDARSPQCRRSIP